MHQSVWNPAPQPGTSGALGLIWFANDLIDQCNLLLMPWFEEVGIYIDWCITMLMIVYNIPILFPTN